MGCICSKEEDEEAEKEKERFKSSVGSSVQLVAPTPVKMEDFVVEVGDPGGGGGGITTVILNEGNKKTRIVQRPTKTHHRWATMDVGRGRGGGGGGGGGVFQPHVQQSSVPKTLGGPEGELVSAGWPSWLASVAGEAIKGWLPRTADSFEKFDKIGQGTYSSVYRARDLETGKIVAMKKVRFFNMDPESVRFMAREIHILRKLDHPNVMKLESIVTSRMSGSLYLVFEYMEHDLAGIAAIPGIRFSESQIKCYMQQLLNGLEHCHNRGILHRDIKGSNLLISNDGILKIGDFGLANFYQPDQKKPLTSRVVTLWYRAPELLLGSTSYGVAIDLWSAGCILAELFAGKPIMPGRTEVEQMHKILKLCGSPSEDYWQKSKFPHATSFKPQQPYKRVLTETFKSLPPAALSLIDKLLSVEPQNRGTATSALRSMFFSTNPLPCDPSSLPKYPPSKELDAKVRNEEAKRRKSEAVKGLGPESVKRGSRESNGDALPQSKVTRDNFSPQEHDLSAFRAERPRGAVHTKYPQFTSVVHPSAVGSSLNNNGNSTRNLRELNSRVHMPQQNGEISNSYQRKDDRVFYRDPGTGCVPRKARIHCSGPLVPPGGNIEDILKEHERQIQEAVRKSRH